MAPQQKSSRQTCWIIILISALALAATPGPDLEIMSPDVALTQPYLTPAQFAYMAEIENSPNRADVSILSANHGDQLGVNRSPAYALDCEACAIFDKNQHGYKVTLPVGWTVSNHFGVADRPGVVELTYWDPLKNRPITLTAEMGFVHTPEVLYSLSRSELELDQVMYVSPSDIGWANFNGQGAVALYPIDKAEFTYVFNDRNTVPIILTDEGLVACLTSEEFRYDPTFVEKGEIVQIVDC